MNIVTEAREIFARRVASNYEQDFSCDALKGRARLVFHAGRAYAVLTFWNALSTGSECSTFFESLKVNTKR
jgi:hypothetical protein